MGQIRYLSPAAIIVDETVHARPSSDPRAIERYREAMQAGAIFPPLVAFDTADGYLLADGFLRLVAYVLNRRQKIRVNVRKGTREDAIAYSVAANADHGEPRTADGVERAILMSIALRPRSTNRAIARLAQVTEAKVDGIRRKHQTR